MRVACGLLHLVRLLLVGCWDGGGVGGLFSGTLLGPEGPVVPALLRVSLLLVGVGVGGAGGVGVLCGLRVCLL